MASRPLAVGCVPIYTAEPHFHRDETRRVGVASFRCARRIGHFRLSRRAATGVRAPGRRPRELRSSVRVVRLR